MHLLDKYSKILQNSRYIHKKKLLLLMIVWVLVFVVFVVEGCDVGGGAGAGAGAGVRRGGGGGGGVGDAGNGGLKCIIIFNFHELRCKHKTKIYRFSKIKQLM